MAERLIYLPLGGAGEIGMNAYVYGYGAPGKTFSVGLGCDIRHACHLVYAQGLDLHAPAAATPIGMGCKVCERHACPQRAFPYIGRALDVDENHSRFTPYGAGA